MKQRICYGAGLVVGLMGALAPAQAQIIISASPTANMSCGGGVCSPTAASANLNTGDLENYLASGSLEVTTTGSGVQASDIVVEAGFSWTNASALALDAYRSVTFQSPVAVNGKGAVSLVTNDGGSGGTLSFISGGSLSFRKPKNNLSIQGKSYKLAGSLPKLAADIAANASGRYALSASYDASKDGLYGQSPVKTKFKGSFNGLGNTISNLSINGGSKELGLFANVKATGTIASVRLTNAAVETGRNSIAGVIAGVNYGTIFNSSAAGTMSAKAGKKGAAFGGLVGSNLGTLNGTAASTDISVSGSGNFAITDVGGLVGVNSGNIYMSYATGKATAVEDITAAGSGGLVGFNADIANIVNCYATGATSVAGSSSAGGLTGVNGWTISNSYSTGAPTGTGAAVGGSIGFDESQTGSLSNVYWDTTTSGITNLSQGAGNIPNDPGITGETTAQLQAGLPAGFDPTIWAENANINGGLPYLIANPPQ
ncbi:MAG TPA: GLUG motif-containing protein [Rhizomicrobium sp.]|jgi:hypothetical protein|nr:GLUG motif-containing protein [Rhizomicrobium sp.]